MRLRIKKIFHDLFKPKFILTNLFLLFLHSSNSQELIIKSDYSIIDYKTLKLKSGKILALTGEIASPFNPNTYEYQSYLYAIDSNGVLLDKKITLSTPLSIGALHPLPNNAIFISTSLNFNCAQCLTGTESSAICTIMDENLSLLDTSMFERNTSLLPINVKNSISISSSTNLVLTRNYIHKLNNSGDSLTSFPNNYNFNEIYLLKNNTILLSNDTLTSLYDTNGTMLVDINSNLSNVNLLNDSNFVALENIDSIVIRNQNLALYKAINLDTSLQNILSINFFNSKIIVFGKTTSNNYKLMRLDTNLMVIDTFLINSYPNIQYEKIFPYHNHFIAVGKETNYSTQAMVFKKFNYANYNLPVITIDAGVIGVQFANMIDTTEYPPPGPSYVRNISYDVYVTIKNHGTVKLDTIMISAKSNYLPGSVFYCYMPYVRDTFLRINLFPGDTTVAYIGRMHFDMVSGTETFSICTWTDMPSYKIDQEYLNNYFCSTVTYLDLTDAEINESIKLYPNPILKGNLLYVLIDNYSFSTKPITILVHDIFGKLITQKNITEQNFTLDSNDLLSGLYFITFLGDFNNTTTKKIIIE